MSENDWEREPIVCQECGETPRLIYDPVSVEEYQLRCDCPIRGIDVTDPVNGSSLTEPMTGIWSNFDHDSTMRYDNE